MQPVMATWLIFLFSHQTNFKTEYGSNISGYPFLCSGCKKESQLLQNEILRLTWYIRKLINKIDGSLRFLAYDYLLLSYNSFFINNWLNHEMIHLISANLYLSSHFHALLWHLLACLFIFEVWSASYFVCFQGLGLTQFCIHTKY